MASKPPTEITDLYSLAEEARPYIAALIEYFEVFDHLKDEIRLAIFFAAEAPRVRGRTAMALVTMPDATGQNRHIYTWTLFMVFGFEPDVVMIISRDSWEMADDYQRFALMYHELRHIYQKQTTKGGPAFSKDTGRPIYEMRDHELGMFFDEAEVFGAWDASLVRAKEELGKGQRFDIAPLLELMHGKAA